MRIFRNSVKPLCCLVFQFAYRDLVKILTPPPPPKYYRRCYNRAGRKTRHDTPGFLDCVVNRIRTTLPADRLLVLLHLKCKQIRRKIRSLVHLIVQYFVRHVYTISDPIRGHETGFFKKFFDVVENQRSKTMSARRLYLSIRVKTNKSPLPFYSAHLYNKLRTIRKTGLIINVQCFSRAFTR